MPDPVEERAKALVSSLKKLSRAELVALHQSFVSRFAADNSGIWSTGAIFVPAAFAAPVAFYSFGHQSWKAFTALCALSLVLLGAWELIAEGHRAFQNRSVAVMRGIELALDLEFGRPKLPDSVAQARLTRIGVAVLRRWLFVALALGWLGIGLDRVFG